MGIIHISNCIKCTQCQQMPNLHALYGILMLFSFTTTRAEIKTYLLTLMHMYEHIAVTQ